ncbi:hypothetical protein TELCIR_05524 [Teladorsagia circumcincta]|uniref:Uncharacterized protein n=1 Tax=Teladorsagia circumcincta TaxID=45464 RepID=A0A2G9US64_TELCI|nr:hypothetical protein TELCIR_05524 [Teladorsagia circumcincta]
MKMFLSKRFRRSTLCRRCSRIFNWIGAVCITALTSSFLTLSSRVQPQAHLSILISAE